MGNKTHGLSNTPEYKCWLQIKARCLRPEHSAYPNYGARGITIYEPWIEDFPAFLEHVGFKPSSKHTLDRIENDKGYEPGNLRWVTWSVQLKNRRKFNTTAVKQVAKNPGKITNFKHGLIDTPEYTVWSNMKDRSFNPNNPAYSDYGGRGITVYKDWIEDFEAFYKYLGPRPTPEHSIDRYPNNDGNYEPGNIRWATKHDQNLNRRPTVTGSTHGNHKHGYRDTPEYSTWGSIKTRCFNTNSEKYQLYGAKGITMCQRWKDSFEQFLEDLGKKPTHEHNIMLIEHEGNYSCGKCEQCLANDWKANCRWATRTEINQHRRSSSRSGKLNPEKIREIRKLLVNGQTCGEVATVFGVGESLIAKIKQGRNWAEVT